MSVAARAASLLVAFLVVVGLGIFVALYYIGGQSSLPTVHYAASGGQVNVMLLNVETAYWNLYGSYWVLYAREQALRQAFEAWSGTSAGPTAAGCSPARIASRCGRRSSPGTSR